MIVYRCYNESDNMNYLFLQTFHNNKWKYNDKSMACHKQVTEAEKE